MEANRGDDPCVTLESLCDIYSGFLDEQMLKIKNKKRYVRKQKADTLKDDELDFLDDEDVESFTGSQADLEGAADNLFASPPRPQPLRFESLCPPHWGVDILLLLFPPSHLISRHFRQQFLSYLYQIWHAGLLG